MSVTGWPKDKILGFRWSKNTKITLETINTWRNISISIFKYSPFLDISNEDGGRRTAAVKKRLNKIKQKRPRFHLNSPEIKQTKL